MFYLFWNKWLKLETSCVILFNFKVLQSTISIFTIIGQSSLFSQKKFLIPYKNNKNLKHKNIKHKITARNFNIYFFSFMHQILFKADFFFEKWSIDPILGIFNFFVFSFCTLKFEAR